MISKLKYIFVIVGLIFIFAGGVLFFASNPKDKEKDIPNEKDKIIVNTSVTDGDDIDSSMYSVYDFGKNFVETTISNSEIYTKSQYVFSYPNSFENVEITDKLLYLKNENSSLIVDYLKEVSLYDFKDFWIKDKKYEKYNIAYSTENIYISDIPVKYFKISSLDLNGLYQEEFLVVFEDSQFGLVCVSFLIDSSKFSDEFLTDFINSFKVIKSDEDFFGPGSKDGFLIGTLKVVGYNNENVYYNLNYKISEEKYSVVKSESNSNSSVLFSSNTMFDLFAEINLMYSDNDSNFYNIYLSNLKKRYESISDYYEVKEIKDSIQNYNGREYYRIDVLGVNTANGGSVEGCSCYAVFKLETGVYYILHISYPEEFSNELFNDFLDIELKKS